MGYAPCSKIREDELGGKSMTISREDIIQGIRDIIRESVTSTDKVGRLGILLIPWKRGWWQKEIAIRTNRIAPRNDERYRGKVSSRVSQFKGELKGEKRW